MPHFLPLPVFHFLVLYWNGNQNRNRSFGLTRRLIHGKNIKATMFMWPWFIRHTHTHTHNKNQITWRCSRISWNRLLSLSLYLFYWPSMDHCHGRSVNLWTIDSNQMTNWSKRYWLCRRIWNVLNIKQKEREREKEKDIPLKVPCERQFHYEMATYSVPWHVESYC